jgi:hypothetical protein
MQKRTSAAGAALVLAASVTGLAATSGSAHATGSHAGRSASQLVVTIRSSAKGITLSDTKIRPGNTMFKVAPHGKGGDLQVLRLRSGYTLTQAFTDINNAFNGDIPSIKRVDKNIVFYGGNRMSPKGAAATFWGVNLDKAGTYYVLNVDNNKLTTLAVKGTRQRRALPATSGVLNPADASDGVTNVWKPGKHIAKSGFMSTTNEAKEPHFVDLGHVKQATTDQQVQDFFNAGAPGQPPFAAKDGATTAAGVISPGKRFVWSYSLPKGKYLVDCFWPSITSGMPHALMGMWKLFNIG